MNATFICTATIIDGNTLHLDLDLPVRTGKVRVMVEVVGEASAKPTLGEYLKDLRALTAARDQPLCSSGEIPIPIHQKRETWCD